MMTTQTASPPVVEATAKMAVTLEAQQWNGVLAALSEAPYRVAAPLIQAIGEQLQQQSQQLQGPGEGPLLNGHAPH